MSRIVNRLGGLLPHFCLFLAIVAPATVIVFTALIPAETLAMAQLLPESAHGQIELGWERRLIAVLILLLPTGCLSYALMNARSSLQRFNRGEYFSTSAIRGIRGFGAGIFWSGLLKLAVRPIAVYVLVGPTPTLHIETSNLVMLATGGILWQIAVMMQRAAELAEENRQFV